GRRPRRRRPHRSGRRPPRRRRTVPRPRPGPRRHPRLVVRRLPRRRGRAAPPRRVRRGGRRRTRDRLEPLRHALHRALPRPPRRPARGLRAQLADHRRAGARACTADRARTRRRQRLRRPRAAAVLRAAGRGPGAHVPAAGGCDAHDPAGRGGRREPDADAGAVDQTTTGGGDRMTQATRWGLTVPLSELSLPDHRELVRRLPDLGYTDLWSAEANGADAFTPLTLASQWAPELRLGTAIAPVYTRGPGLLAMSAAALAECAPDRFVLGVGTSSQTIVEDWNATPFTEPYARTRDTVRFLRAALAGEKVTERYPTFAVRGFRLGRPPRTAPPLMVAALRPGMLRLAGREADGAITNWLAASDVPAVRGELGSEAELVARIFVCPTPDADTARALARRHIAGYLTVPVYRAL